MYDDKDLSQKVIYANKKNKWLILFTNILSLDF